MSLKDRVYSYKNADVLLGIIGAVLLIVLALSLILDSAFLALVSGVGLAVVVVLVGSVNISTDDSRAQATERTLRVAANTMEHLHGGLTAENAQAICSLLLPETNASGIAITDTNSVLAYQGSIQTRYQPGTPNTRPTLEVLESKRTETFAQMDEEGTEIRRISVGRAFGGHSYGIIVPLLVQDRAVGTIKLYYSRDTDIDKTQLAIADGLGTLLSTQLSSHELDRQAELTARAEVKALQAQINPHFLFNTLNTISSFTRTDPTKARDLLREFSLFYRKTLENSEKTLIPLSQELEQTRRYLNIEKARFGEDRIEETEHVERGCERLPVPAFIVQPIVENSVRHAMRDEGTLHIDVHVVIDGNDILIAVADDGLGMDESVAQRLADSTADEGTMQSNSSEGTGVALRNVAERLVLFFGAGSGIEIVSKVDEGSCVTLRLAGALQKLEETSDSEEEQ